MQPPRRTLVAALAIIACVLVTSGCRKFNSRRLINEGNKLYKEGKYEKAAEMFEDALKEEDLDVGHYNLGLTYVKLFIPGSTSEQNKQYADRAAQEFAKWLVKHPKDNEARAIMTGVWVDSGDFEKALAYWQAEHEKDPKNRDIMNQMAKINQSAQRFDEMVRWLRLDASAADTNEGKIKTLVSIGRSAAAKLQNRDKVILTERIHVADVGISALQEVLAMDANNLEALGLLTTVFKMRSVAHGAFWAAEIDRAIAENYDDKWRVLNEARKKKAAEQEAAQGQQPAPTKADGT
jgi:tetratricopeptide (TPR) repeat protein